jgi:hypothetical protein
MVEEFIALLRCEEEQVHRMVEDSFGYLHEDRLRTWLRERKKDIKACRAAACPQLPVSRINEIHEIWKFLLLSVFPNLILYLLFYSPPSKELTTHTRS